MKKTSLIGHVVEVLELASSHTRPADAVIGDFFRSRRYLGSKDRRYISETVFDILRNLLLLQSYGALARIPAHPAPAPARPLELYVCYARVIRNEEPSAIQADVAPLWPGPDPAAGLAQYLGALRAGAAPPPETGPALRLSIVHSIPQVIVEEWIDRFGEEEAERLSAACNISAPTTLRVNTLRCTVEECQNMLRQEGVASARTGLSPVGLTLEKRVNIQGLRAFREGMCEVQDEGSQLLSLLLEPLPGSRVVDACAGAGGKTLHIAALMENQGSILAIDSERRRLEALKERARRAGVTTVASREAGDPRIQEWVNYADAVLVDVPCSAVGTFRRNPGAKSGYDRLDLPALAALQFSLLADSARLVRPGGRLVYATCTLVTRENEEIVDRFLREKPGFRPVPARAILARQGVDLPSGPSHQGRSPGSPYLLLLPHRTGTDGFFAAVLERQA